MPFLSILRIFEYEKQNCHSKSEEADTLYWRNGYILSRINKSLSDLEQTEGVKEITNMKHRMVFNYTTEIL